MNALNMSLKKKLCYIWDENLIKHCDRLPAVLERASLVHNLIEAYGLLQHLITVRSSPATYNEMRQFHSELYLDHLKNIKEIDEEYMSSAEDENYGIGYDCAPVSNMFELVSTIAGGSVTAAKSLVLNMADIVMNWCGGWHHAQRFGADGFCYINDIVLAIEMLRKKYPKVLYIDLDVHHGNGVQDAYNISKAVFTLSIHKYEPGFYPGTGSLSDIGSLDGTGYSCNIPLEAGYTDDTLLYVFEKVFPSIYSLFSPDAIVVQCGADALAHDPHGGANLTTKGYFDCLQLVLDKQKPTLLLGGGGYKHPNAARLWTSITALVTGVDLDENIPEHSHWTTYGPGYMLPVESGLAKDCNKRSYIDSCIGSVLENLQKHLGGKAVETNPLKTEYNDNKMIEDNKLKPPLPNKTEKAEENEIRTRLKFNLKSENQAANYCTDIYEFTDD